jgi:integrase
MARPATGSVVEDRRSGQLVYALRFRAQGKRQYVALGSAREGWTRHKAEEELAYVLAQVRRGQWQAPEAPVAAAGPRGAEQSFHAFASEWFERKRLEIDENTQLDYRWQLTHHLLPFFQDHALSAITAQEIDRYRQQQVRRRERPAADSRSRGLSNTSINKTLARLAQILDDAVEYGLLETNPARGRRRYLPQAKPNRSFLEADQVAALLEAAAELDREARRDRRVGRQALLATLVLAGLRVGELCALRVRDVDLAAGRLAVHDAKTDAGAREVDLTPALRELLIEHHAGAAHAAPDDPFFATHSGRPRDKDNVRNRVLRPALERAAVRLRDVDAPALPEAITPHSLRRTYISLLLTAGADPQYVMQQVGHTDPALTLRIYAQVLKRRQRQHGAAVDDLLHEVRLPPAVPATRIRQATPAAVSPPA